MGNKKKTLLGAEYKVQDGAKTNWLAQAGRNIKANVQQVIKPAIKSLRDCTGTCP